MLQIIGYGKHIILYQKAMKAAKDKEMKKFSYEDIKPRESDDYLNATKICMSNREEV